MDKTYQTTTMPLAAWLIYCGVPLINIYKDKHLNKKIFEFERVDNLDQLLESYWKNEARVAPESFWHILKSLKSRIYDIENG